MRKKLQSRSGASIVFALFIFLFCAFVGASILVIASTTTGELSDKQKNDQAYYTLTSLADYLSGELTNTTYYYDVSYETDPAGTIASRLYPTTGIFNSAVKEMADQVSGHLRYDNTTPSDPKVMTFTFSSEAVNNTALGSEPVRVRFIMNADYDITVTLDIPDVGSQSVYMEFKAAPYENIDHSAYTSYERVEGSADTRIPISVTWTEGQILTGGSI